MLNKIKELKKNENFRQLFKFGIVGVLNTIVGYGCYYIGIKLGLHYAMASAISQVIGTAHSYVWNKLFTFKSKKKSLSEMLRFISVYFVQYIINVTLTGFFINYFKLTAEIAGLMALVICTAVSFIGHKFWSFKGK